MSFVVTTFVEIHTHTHTQTHLIKIYLAYILLPFPFHTAAMCDLTCSHTTPTVIDTCAYFCHALYVVMPLDFMYSALRSLPVWNLF
jgi:hypothetical protein